MNVDSQPNIISKFYEYAEKLDAQPEFQGDEDLYSEIISLSQSSNQSKRLTPQFVSKYFKRFPKLQEKAVDALIDLLESEDIPIRVGAIKSVPEICQQDPKLISKMVDILAQLLNTDSKVESEAINNTLLVMYKINSIDTLNSMLTYLESPEEQGQQEQITTKSILIKLIKNDFLSQIRSEYIKAPLDTQTFFRNRIFNLLGLISSKNENTILFELFDCFPNYQYSDIIKLVDTFLIKIENDSVKDSFPKILNLLRILTHRADLITSAMKLQIQEPITSKFYKFICEKVLKSWNELSVEDNQLLLKTEFLSNFAMISTLIPITEIKEFIEPLYKIFTDYAPLVIDESVDIQWVNIESILYSFLALCQRSISSTRLLGYQTVTGQPSDMAQEVNKDRLNDYQARLRILNAKSKEIALKVKKTIDSLKKEDAQKQFLKKSLVAMENISIISHNFLHTPPTLSLSNIRLSSQKQQKSLKFKSFSTNQSPILNSQTPQNKPQPTQKLKENRYKPYVPPNKRDDAQPTNNNKNKKKNQKSSNNGDNSGVTLNFFTEKHKKPSSFKGRGSQTY